MSDYLSNYKSTDEWLQPIPAAENDVEVIKRVLLDPALGEFEQANVKTLINPASHLMRLKIEQMFLGRGKNDLILFYFSGHGLKDDEGNLYFATTDTDTDTVGESNLCRN